MNFFPRQPKPAPASVYIIHKHENGIPCLVYFNDAHEAVEYTRDLDTLNVPWRTHIVGGLSGKQAS